MSSWVGVQHRRRAKQLYSYEGLFVDGSWATDIDGVMEWKDKGYVFFELKRPGVSMPNGQRLALERLVNDLQKVGKRAILLLCENDVADPDEDVKVKDCRVLKMYDGTWHDSPYIYAGDVVNDSLFREQEREDNLNSVCITGNITRDFECRYTQSNTAVAKFTVAVSRMRKDDEADFIPVTVFGKQAENCEKYLHKGSKVGVTGRIQTGSYEKDGQTHYTTDVIANAVDFMDSRQSGGNSNAQRPKAATQEQVNEQFEALSESVPF